MARPCGGLAVTTMAEPLRCYSVGYPGPARLGDGLHYVRFQEMRAFVLTLVLIFGSATVEAQDSLWPDVPIKAKKFTCSPGRLVEGEVLTIRMSTPHPHELGVRTPKRGFVMLHMCAEGRPRDECKAFTQVGRVSMGTSEVLLPVSGGGPKESHKLFREQGWYTFFLSQNLETENTDETVNRCRVYFEGARRD